MEKESTQPKRRSLSFKEDSKLSHWNIPGQLQDGSFCDILIGANSIW